MLTDKNRLTSLGYGLIDVSVPECQNKDMNRQTLEEMIDGKFDNILKQLANDELDNLVEKIKTVKRERKKRLRAR